MSKLPFALAAFFAGLALAVLMTRGDSDPASDTSAPTPVMAEADGPAPSAVLAASLEQPDNRITIFKSPTCGCCGDWAAHLRENGFEVTEIGRADMVGVKAEVGVPGELHSCHTAMVGGELVEGHVPADVIRDYLNDEAARSASLGLAVPGMPIGSPGMEIEGQPAESYDVMAFSAEGATAYASR
jgi:hypothetical protein